MKKLLCATLDGIDAKVVDVELAFVRALPSFSIVGLAQTSIQESKERVKSSLDSINFKFPPQKVTVNLSPSDLRKEGSHFDLPIALLVALYKDDKVNFDEFIALGELGLDGMLKDTNSIFAIILSLANDNKIKKVLIPHDSYKKVSKIPNIEIYCAKNLKEAIDIFKDEQINPKITIKVDIDAKYIELDEKYYYYEDYHEDFIDVKGQEIAKRASLISASGMHNLLLIGSPGSGKSMSAKRLRYIMPPLSISEILANAKLDSLVGEDVDFSPLRKFRSPHRSSTQASIFGGGSKNAKIGEIALAGNGGILFFDEFPHFQKSIIESLREPLEDNKVFISRVNSKIEYKTNFLFVAAMNPCPCGNLYSKTKDCRCSEVEINRYMSKISSPIKDRIDLFVQMDESSIEDKPSISSKNMHKMVIDAFIIQKQRGQKDLNGKMSDKDISKYCKLSSDCKDVLDKASVRFSLSQRSINKILKVARTIADLDKSDKIKKKHLLEALSFRSK